MDTEKNIVIVGSGIAGLYCAYHLSKTGHEVIVFEKYDKIGGRAKTIEISPNKSDKYLLEAGAGIVRSDEYLIIDLADELGVEMNFWNSKSDIIYHDPKTKKNELLNLDYYKIMKKVCKNSNESKSFLDVIKNTYIDEKETIGLLIGTTYSELYFSNSEHVCEDNDFHEFMMNGTKYQYGKPKKGWSELTKILQDEIIKYNGKIYTNSPVLEIQDNYVIVNIDEEIRKVEFSKLFVTAPMHFIKNIELTPSLDKWYNIASNFIEETNYLRIYSYFESPLKISNKIATNLSIRRVIPITDKLIMTVYTDGKDADDIYKMSKDEKKLNRYIKDELKKLLDVKIPKITKNWVMYWDKGISTWLPNTTKYNLEEIIEYIQHPIPNIYFCGDTYSMNPGWISGAMNSANQALTNSIKD